MFEKPFCYLLKHFFSVRDWKTGQVGLESNANNEVDTKRAMCFLISEFRVRRLRGKKLRRRVNTMIVIYLLLPGLILSFRQHFHSYVSIWHSFCNAHTPVQKPSHAVKRLSLSCFILTTIIQLHVYI